MNVMQAPGATVVRQANRVDGRHFLKPDSALVRAALDLLSTHVPDAAAGISPRCAQCGRYFPCPTVDNARQVVVAGGGLLGVAGKLEQKATRGPADRVEAADLAGRESEPAAAPGAGGRAEETPDTVAGPVPVDRVVEAPRIAVQRVPGSTEKRVPRGAEKRVPKGADKRAPKGPGKRVPDIAAQRAPASAEKRVPESAAQSAPESAERRVPDIAAKMDDKPAAPDPVDAA